MSTYRTTIFVNEEIYHVYNRGVERRTLYTSPTEYRRFVNLLAYYRFADVPVRYSQLHQMTHELQRQIWRQLEREDKLDVSILAYCLMPNHFHCILRQKQAGGITRFVSNVTNGYTKYFNTRHDRVGPLVQGTFKAVHVETGEQLLHLSRYIHINPVVSSIIPQTRLDTYAWSSFPKYLSGNPGICDTSWIKGFFKKSQNYRTFVHDHVAYAKEIEKVKHLTLEK